MAKINNLIIPYDDFEMGEMIDPEQFDTNNHYIEAKVNELVKTINDLMGFSNTGISGTEIIGMKPIPPFTEANLQDFLTKLITRLRAVTVGNGGSRFIGSEIINGLQGNTVFEQISNLNRLLSTERSKLSSLYDSFTIHNHDNRYMTRTEIAPFLTGGDTRLLVDVFTIETVGPTSFTYKNKTGQILTGELGTNGEQIFTLSDIYTMNNNAVKAIINDTLHRSVASGGLTEVTDKKIALTYPEGVGSEITIEYFQRVGLAGEYSVIFSKNLPAPSTTPKLWFKEV